MESAKDSYSNQAICKGSELPLSDFAVLPHLLQAQWGITLWRLRIKGKQIKLKMEASRPVDELALRAWLTEQVGTEWEISMKFCAMSTCCGSGCKGCFIGNL